MDRKLVVLGIPWEIDTEGLREYMSKFGELEDCIVMKERSSGRSRGFGYVTFVSAEDAKAVLSGEHFLGKRMLEVKVATPKEEMRAPSKKATRIFVARIPPSVTETTFRSHFEKYGEIIDLYMPKDHSSKAHRGIGFITYASAEMWRMLGNVSLMQNTEMDCVTTDSVDNLMAETHELGGSTVVVDRATPKASFYTAAFFLFKLGLFLSYGKPFFLLAIEEDDLRPTGRMAPGGYGAYNAYISAATRYAALGAPTLYDHPAPFYGRGESSRGMGKKIFVGRLPQEASAEDLRQYFGRFGHILDVYVPKDPKRTGHRGFGFVTFAEDGVADRVSRRSHEICGHQVAIDSATPIDDAAPSGNFMMSGPEPFGSYAGPMRNFGRMYGALDYDDASAYMVPSKWGYGMGSARPSRADWRTLNFLSSFKCQIVYYVNAVGMYLVGM
ncbi:hypothetical protein DKX38_011217 [Salix brachista]|uniref:RRM domain-containing protein n=1 Tax=Salix brachista TaxID=2182728 RepID=A0A5N5M0G3_9ROSI|nr:hypothetical protein DKX38_011217 [Salix brachista]